MEWILWNFVAASILLMTVHSKVCNDKSTHCGAWKKVGYCNPSSTFIKFMQQNCEMACGLCVPPPPTLPPAGCFDKGGFCSSYVPYCNDPDYRDYVIKECKRSCNFCHITTKPPPTTTTPVPYTGAGGRVLQPGCGHKGPGHTRIVGGTNAKPGDWPWMVNIDYEKNFGNPGHHCGGTLINEEWVLTAAHCFDDRKKERYWLKLGEHNIKVKNSHEQRFNFSELIIHPNYNKLARYDYDVALVRLDRKATLGSRVRTACLPDHNTNFPVGTNCYISGWGLLSDYGIGPAILQQAKVPLVSMTDCKNVYQVLGNTVTPRMMCAGFSNGTIDSCQGDSGGPLVCKNRDASGNDVWYLRGAVSWGVGCAQKGLYGVYADVVTVRRWIDSIVFK